LDELLRDVHIRRIKAEDADDISGILSIITKDPSDVDFGRIIGEQLRRAEDASFVAEVEGKVVGYMISYIVYGGYGYEKSAWIAMLGVDPKFMGQGVGKMLAEEIFGVYQEKGIRNIFTSVRWDSVDLLSFFKTLGFDRSKFINLRKRLES
jgi:ribosomal protein S18 acetylase RimI-like enzyme